MSQWQPEDPFERQRQPPRQYQRPNAQPNAPMHVQPQGQQQYPQTPRIMEARGTVKTVTWDGRTLAIRTPLGGGVVTIPARQVAAVRIMPLGPRLTVMTTSGRAYPVPYWPWRGRDFRALRDAVMGAVAAMTS